MYICRVEEEDRGRRQQRGQWGHGEAERWGGGGGPCLKNKKRKSLAKQVDRTIRHGGGQEGDF